MRAATPSVIVRPRTVTLRGTFLPEFKAEAVRLCKVGDRSVRQVAKDLDLTPEARSELLELRKRVNRRGGGER